MVCELTSEEIERYARHLLIPEVGEEGQRKLKQASVLVIGVGGLGSPIALYLAAAGVGHIGIVDPDSVALSNLQRQVIYANSNLNQKKVESAKKRMLDINPNIQVDVFCEGFSLNNAERIAEDYEILVDGTDNLASRYLINDLAILTQKPYVYGSVFQFEGQASTFFARQGPCYRCLFPIPPKAGTIPASNEVGVFGILPGTIGTIEATETIKLILGIGEPLFGKLLLYDALDMSFQLIHLKKDPDCKICGKNPQIDHLIDYDEFCA